MDKLYKKIKTDPIFRLRLNVTISFFLNVIFAAYNGYLAIKGFSYWFLTMSVYYVILGLGRYICIFKGLHRPGNNKKQILMSCGILLCLLSVILVGSVTLSLKLPVIQKQSLIPMITSATYTFYKMTLAIINLIKAKSSKSALTITIRNLSMADAVSSMLMLERIMVTSLESDANYAFNMTVSTGAGAYIIVLLLGITTILSSKKQSQSIHIK